MKRLINVSSNKCWGEKAWVQDYKVEPSHFVDPVQVMQLSVKHIWLYMWRVLLDHALLPYV